MDAVPTSCSVGDQSQGLEHAKHTLPLSCATVPMLTFGAIDNCLILFQILAESLLMLLVP